jgi:hypothetical protein
MKVASVREISFCQFTPKEREWMVAQGASSVQFLNQMGNRWSCACELVFEVVRWRVQADPAVLFNVPVIPLGALMSALHPLVSRPPYALSYLGYQVSARQMMDPALFKKLVLNNFCKAAAAVSASEVVDCISWDMWLQVVIGLLSSHCNLLKPCYGSSIFLTLAVADEGTVPVKLLLQLATVFQPGGLRDRSGTVIYKDGLKSCKVPVLAIAGDLDLICPPAAVLGKVPWHASLGFFCIESPIVCRKCVWDQVVCWWKSCHFLRHYQGIPWGHCHLQVVWREARAPLRTLWSTVCPYSKFLFQIAKCLLHIPVPIHNCHQKNCY